MERSGKDGALSARSAVQEVSQAYAIPVLPIANLNDLFEYLSSGTSNSELARHTSAVAQYRQRYGSD
jgi:orotate phosphoribosyltransferase